MEDSSNEGGFSPLENEIIMCVPTNLHGLQRTRMFYTQVDFMYVPHIFSPVGMLVKVS